MANLGEGNYSSFLLSFIFHISHSPTQVAIHLLQRCFGLSIVASNCVAPTMAPVLVLIVLMVLTIAPIVWMNLSMVLVESLIVTTFGLAIDALLVVMPSLVRAHPLLYPFWDY